MKKVKDKSKLSDYQREKLQDLESRSDKDNLKKDVGLTDKKGDNLPLENKDDRSHSSHIHGKKGPRK